VIPKLPTEYVPFPQPEGITLRSSDLKRHISELNRWLKQWVDTGSNPFIHKRLYQIRFPRCIQDAYMALSCYFKKTPSNEQVIARITEDNATQLLQDYTVSTEEPKPAQHIGMAPNPIDCLEYVARVQALLVYQFLGLYDGDIRMRYLALSRIPALYSWVQQLLAHFAQTTQLGSTLGSPASRDEGSLACGVQAQYVMLQQSGTILCQSNIMYTPRKGAWEADSSLAWEKVSSNADLTLVQIADSRQVFTSLGPDHVDDFTMLILEMRSGIDQVKRWGARVEG